MQNIIISLLYTFSDWFEYCKNLVAMLFSKPMLSVPFGKFRIVHTKLAYICVCRPMHNSLLQALIDMRSDNYENKLSSQPFVLLLLEKFICMLIILLDTCTLYSYVLFVNA